MKSRRCSGDRGTALILLLILLCLLAGPLAALTGMARQETVTSGKEVLAERAAGVARGAFWEWAARFPGDPGLAPPSPLWGAEAPWVSRTLSGFRETASWRVAAETVTLDGESSPPLLYNRSSGFDGSPFETGGYPVLRVSSEARLGEHRARLDTAVTFRCFEPPALAALVANGPLHLAGPAVFDGRDHGADGLPAADGEDLAAVVAAGEVTAGEGVLLEGPEGIRRDLPEGLPIEDPYGVLGLARESRYLEKRLLQGEANRPLSGTRVFRNGLRGEVRGEGTLVVHNPRYDPARYLASVEWSRGSSEAAYDPAYSHLDPENQPAVLQPEGESSYRGVIVADSFLPGSGSLELTGQMFVLDRLPTVLGMSGGMLVTYSRLAVREHGHGDCDLVLWEVAGPLD